MKKALFWILLLAAIGGGAWYYFNHIAAEEGKKATQQVVTATVERRTLRRTVESTGEVRPENRLQVTPPIAGRIEELSVREGDGVERGQIIGWLSSTERAGLLDIARAQGAEAVAYWENIYRATPLIAPLSGTVIVRNLQPGQTVTASSEVVVIADRLILVGLVDETDIGRIFRGQQVGVQLDAYPESAFSGQVQRIAFDSRLVSNVTMYEVYVDPDTIPDFARSGMTATLTFLIEERMDVPAVPTAALQYGPRGAVHVLIPAGPEKEPEQRRVSVGLRDRTMTEITKGLEVGEEVLIPQIQMPSGRNAVNPFMPGATGGGRGGR